MTTAMTHHVPGLSLTAEQVADRRNRLGASEVPAVLGLSKYKSPLALWAEKRGLIAPFDGNEFSEWGTRLEGVVADAYAEKRSQAESTTLGVESCSTVIIPEGWRSATPDRKVFRVEDMVGGFAPWLRGLEVKCRGDYSAADFGEPGTDQVPDEVAIQCHTNMSVLRVVGIIVEQWDVATLIGGNRFRSYRLYYDKDIDAAITEKSHEFWHKYVVPGVEPPVDGSDATTKYLQEKFKKNSDLVVEATPEQEVLALELRHVREQIKDLETREAEIKNQFMSWMAEAASLKTRFGRIDWKAPNGNSVKWKEVAEALGAPAELIAKYSTPLGRRFTPYLKKDK
jgi:predicted phage-related endonuclease